MRKLTFILILSLATTLYAADTKTTALTENTTIADADWLFMVDVGATLSQKITVLNLFDTIDTFAELNTITADKTLVNEEDVATFDAIITFATNIAFSDAATIDQSANNYIDFTENGDVLQFYFDATDLGIIFSDGALNLQNAEDGVNAIVNIMGKDAGEYGILRLLSDGDDKYLELYNDDTDGVITNSVGNIIINPVGLGIVIGDNGDEDYTLTFDGDTSDGVLTYDEDNADFEFDQDIATTGDILVSGGNINTGAVALVVGDAATTSIQLLTDGTGDAEIALPNDAIGDAEINWATCTLADFDFETAWKMWHSDAAGDVTEITLGANGTFLESNGAAFAPAFRVLAAGDIPDISATYQPLDATLTDIADGTIIENLVNTNSPWADNEVADNITIDLATLATTVTLANDNATNDNQDIIFTADAAGPVNLEADTGDFHYNPSTGTVTATEFVGGGAGITGVTSSVLYHLIGDPTAAGSITFQDTETATYITETTATDFFEIQATGVFGDISLFRVSQGTGNPTDGALAEFVTADAEDDVDQLLLGNSTDDQVTFRIIEAGTLTIDVISDGTPQTQFSDLVTGNAGITVATTTAFSFGASRIDNGADLIDGEQIGNDTIDNDSIDFADMTDLDTDGVVIWGNITAGELADDTVNDDDINWGDIGNLAAGGAVTLSATVTVTDDEATDDDQEVVFTTDNTNLESDGNFHYSPDTGTVTATEFVGGGAGITGVGATAWDDIADPDLAQTLDFVTYTQTIDIGVTDTGGPKSGLILDVTGLGAGITDVIALEITTSATTAETDYVPIAIFTDSGAANSEIFRIDSYGAIVLINDGMIRQSANNYISFGDNSDEAQFYFGGTDIDLRWDDGALNLRNEEDGVDAIVNISGKDANEKGILRVMSDGDDNYIELHHDDTDGHIVTDTGDIHIEPAGGDVSLAASNLDTTGNVNFGGADLELPQATPATPDADGEVELDFTDGKVVIQHGAAHAELGGATDVVVGTLIQSWSGTIFEPDGVNDVLTVKAINSIEFPHGVVITAVYLGVSEDSDYTLVVQNFDDFDTINAGNPTIDTVAYSNDTTGEIIDTTPTYDDIAAGQIIMISIPATDVDWIHFEIYYYEPAA